MRGLSRVIIGLIIIWMMVAVTETAGVPILPRSTSAVLPHPPAQSGPSAPFR